MNQLTYNVCMALALVLVTAGTGLIWGLGAALIVCGVLLVTLTGFSALMSD